MQTSGYIETAVDLYLHEGVSCPTPPVHPTKLQEPVGDTTMSQEQACVFTCIFNTSMRQHGDMHCLFQYLYLWTVMLIDTDTEYNSCTVRIKNIDCFCSLCVLTPTQKGARGAAFCKHSTNVLWQSVQYCSGMFSLSLVSMCDGRKNSTAEWLCLILTMCPKGNCTDKCLVPCLFNNLICRLVCSRL